MSTTSKGSRPTKTSNSQKETKPNHAVKKKVDAKSTEEHALWVTKNQAMFNLIDEFDVEEELAPKENHVNRQPLIRNPSRPAPKIKSGCIVLKKTPPKKLDDIFAEEKKPQQKSADGNAKIVHKSAAPIKIAKVNKPLKAVKKKSLPLSPIVELKRPRRQANDSGIDLEKIFASIHNNSPCKEDASSKAYPARKKRKNMETDDIDINMDVSERQEAMKRKIDAPNQQKSTMTPMKESDSDISIGDTSPTDAPSQDLTSENSLDDTPDGFDELNDSVLNVIWQEEINQLNHSVPPSPSTFHEILNPLVATRPTSEPHTMRAHFVECEDLCIPPLILPPIEDRDDPKVYDPSQKSKGEKLKVSKPTISVTKAEKKITTKKTTEEETREEYERYKAGLTIDSSTGRVLSSSPADSNIEENPASTPERHGEGKSGEVELPGLNVARRQLNTGDSC
ncbi:hypothetical protein PROFUN_06159 [Planoprotostelium fungivorum]|uniref:Uncharacterized protein n=1 Tax=Planoprotostelium fungivorum TaxID=1890364 RepID=A0A2P6NPK3_9EUKA|nr:hypothetical protein PROFUN_06159 [Planoprotostelium fungivorum]